MVYKMNTKSIFVGAQEEEVITNATDITTTTVVKLRNGKLCGVLLNDSEDTLSLYSKNDFGQALGQARVSEYIDDLTNIKNKSYDIMAYAELGSQSSVIQTILTDKEDISWDAVREEIKSMTVKDIEAALGYRVNIVEEVDYSNNKTIKIEATPVQPKKNVSLEMDDDTI